MNNPDYWFCIIGPAEKSELPWGADSPMRMAAQRTFEAMTKLSEYDCWSGWGTTREQVGKMLSDRREESKFTSMDVGECKTAEEMGIAMMQIPMRMLPKLAMEFARQLCSEVGMCGETLLTAYTVYAQCVHNLPCTDDLYKVRPDHARWFERKLEEVSEEV